MLCFGITAPCSSAGVSAAESGASRKLHHHAVSDASPVTREQLIAVAESWLSTPTFRYGNSVKGVSADCASWMWEVYRECGLIPPNDKLPIYLHDWWAHTSEERYKRIVLRYARQIVKAAAPNAVVTPCPGDIGLTNACGARLLSHGAIVVAWPVVIHATINGIKKKSVVNDPLWTGNRREFFSPWREEIKT